MSGHRSVQDLEFYSLISRLMPILPSRGIFGRVHKCASIRSRIRILQLNQQVKAHITNSLEGRSQLSVECTPPTLVSIWSTPSPLCVKLCSMSVHRSILDLEFYHLISNPILHTRGILGSRSRLTVECTPPTLVSISSSPSPLSVELCSMSVH